LLHLLFPIGEAAPRGLCFFFSHGVALNLCFPISSHKTLFVQDYYKYGSANYTGHDGSATDEVVCEPYSTTNFLAVSYACDTSISSGPIPPEVGFGFNFNLKCTAMPAKGLIFECFDLAPDTDFSGFELSINNTSPIECAKEMIYAYQVLVGYTQLTDAGGIDSKSVTFSPGATTFDPEFAVNVSMLSTLVSDATPSPTSLGNATMSPSAVPVEPSSASKVTLTGSACLLAALALLWV
jgi:hypothetical protein